VKEVNAMLARIPLLAVSLLLLSANALAVENNQIEFKDYTIHYNVFPSTALSPRIADATGIKRDPSHLVLTMVVNKNQGSEAQKSVKADISGNVINIYGQVRQLRPREINDRGVIYYISDFGVAENARLKFLLNVVPEGERKGVDFRFTR
jgi:hypothetical protein